VPDARGRDASLMFVVSTDEDSGRSGGWSDYQRRSGGSGTTSDHAASAARAPWMAARLPQPLASGYRATSNKGGSAGRGVRAFVHLSTAGPELAVHCYRRGRPSTGPAYAGGYHRRAAPATIDLADRDPVHGWGRPRGHCGRGIAGDGPPRAAPAQAAEFDGPIRVLPWPPPTSVWPDSTRPGRGQLGRRAPDPSKPEVHRRNALLAATARARVSGPSAKDALIGR